MLTHIQVKDLAIVTSAEVELGPGMTTLTGETGAGKSILIEALGLTLGDRTDNDMIRVGCERAEVTASFDTRELPEASAWLEDQSLATEDECILRRVLVRDGRSRAFVNGSMVPLRTLQELGALLVDIQGQHAHQALLRRDAQRRLLDNFADHPQLLDRTTTLCRRYQTSLEKLARLREAAADRSSRLDLVRYQVGELSTLGLSGQELRELERSHERLANLDDLRQGCQQALVLLDADDTAVQPLLNQALAALDGISALDRSLSDATELLDGARIQVQEAVSALRGFLDDLETDPDSLQAVEQRLGSIHDMAHKYRVRPEQLPEHLETLRVELEELEQADVHLVQLESETDALAAGYRDAARALTTSRGEAARRLEHEVTEAMRDLNMSSGIFRVQLSARKSGQPAPSGQDAIEFLVTTNRDQPPQPLAKVASGGELSRISLAIQVVTARYTPVATLIFDEVDVGIGGATAEVVGRMLRRLGETRQVLCVTHLPQVAALGHQHLQVRKHDADGETQTGISLLRDEPRVQEIARMLGGIKVTEQTLAHAREMIEQALES